MTATVESYFAGAAAGGAVSACGRCKLNSAACDDQGSGGPAILPLQRALDPSIPACPSSSSSHTLDAYAQKLLDTGKVTFPSSTQVQVIGPEARVDYVWAGATGATQVTQSKSATAKVSSPGGLLPIGLSLQCLAGVINQAGRGAGVDKLLPLSYVVPGSNAGTGALPCQLDRPRSPWVRPSSAGTIRASAVSIGAGIARRRTA